MPRADGSFLEQVVIRTKLEDVMDKKTERKRAGQKRPKREGRAQPKVKRKEDLTLKNYLLEPHPELGV